MLKRVLTIFLVILLLQNILFARCACNAQEFGSVNTTDLSAENPIEIEADTLEYLEESGEIIARGDVVITFSGNMLKTQEIVYNRNSGIITVPSIVFIEDSEKNKFNAQKGVINIRWDGSEIDDVIAILAKKGEIQASKVKVIQRQIIEAKDVYYTMCDVCNHDFDGPYPPLWVLKSQYLKRDGIKERIKMKNSVLKVLGMPIAYLPYVSFPIPGASRQNGLLAPILRWERDFGLNVKFPIYFSLAPHMDLTITPWVMEHFGNQLAVEYRRLTKFGQYKVIVSGARTSTLDEDGNLNSNILKSRGHIHSFGHFDLPVTNAKSIFDYEIFRLRDDLKTYLKKYHINDDDILTSNVSYYYFRDREYVTFDTIQFQGLREFDSFAITPQAYPKVQYYKSFYLMHGLSLNYFADFLHLYRSEGRNVDRIVMESKLEGKKRAHAYNLEYFASIRGDYYNSDVSNPDGFFITRYNDFRMIDQDNSEIDDFRFFPATGFKFSVPFYAKYKEKKFLLQPTLGAVISSTLSEDKQFVNEDSQSPELHIENLFLPNIYKGKDRIQDGSRIMYSLRSFYNEGKYKLFFEFGQMYSFNHNNVFDKQSGLSDFYSDFVSIFSIKYSDFVELVNKLRIDKSNFNFENNETSLKVDYKRLKLKMDFYGLGKKAIQDTDLRFRNELKSELEWTLDRHWDVKYSNRSHIGAMQEGERKLIDHALGLVYKGKCLNANFSIEKDFTRLNDYTPSTNYSLSINVPIN